MSTLIPGYLTVVTVNSEDLTTDCSVYRLNLNRTVNRKNLAGSKWAGALGGQQFFAFGIQGSLSNEKAEALNTAVNTGRITGSLQIGEAAGATDGGLYSGTFEVSSFSVEGNADGEFDFTLDMESAGTVTYTAPSGS